MTKNLLVRKKIRLPKVAYRRKHSFSITIATHKKFNWFSTYPGLCKQAVKVMREISLSHNASIFAWCIMPNHIHLLLQSENVIDFVRLFKGKLTPKARELFPKQRLWQRSFYDHALRRDEDLYNVARYIWENPVRAGFVENPCDYAWSGSEVWTQWRHFYGRV